MQGSEIAAAPPQAAVETSGLPPCVLDPACLSGRFAAKRHHGHLAQLLSERQSLLVPQHDAVHHLRLEAPQQNRQPIAAADFQDAQILSEARDSEGAGRLPSETRDAAISRLLEQHLSGSALGAGLGGDSV